MERRSARSEIQHDIRETHEQDRVRFSVSHVPFLSFVSILRYAVLIGVVVFLAESWDEKPPSHGSSLLGTHPGKVIAVAFSPNGRWLASAGYYSPVVIWDMTLRQIETILEQSPASTTSVAFSPDGTNLAATGLDGTVRIWNTGAWSMAHHFQAQAPGAHVLAFSPDGKLLATGGADRRHSSLGHGHLAVSQRLERA